MTKAEHQAAEYAREAATQEPFGEDCVPLRDYFAAQALTGVIQRLAWNPRAIVQAAYEIADEMEKQRTTKPKE